MGEKDSTVRMRELGLALRKAMLAADLDNKAMAHKLRCSQSKISNMLGARRGVSEADVATFLAHCGVVGAERDRLLRLAREAHEPSWWREQGDPLAGDLTTLIDHETSAVAISQYASTVIPGLLQVRDYIRAWRRVSVSAENHESEERIEAQIKRQDLFNRHRAPQCGFFLDEYALRTSSAGREVMSEQVHHLLRLAVRPYVSIRIIPEAVGLHAGYLGPFTLMEFTEVHPMVHIESENAKVFAERPESIRLYREVLAALAEVALDREESREWISRRAHELGAPREENDESD